MRTRNIAVVAVVVSACSTAPISFLSMTPSPADAAFSCALRQINTMNYTVTNTNKEAGFIAAEKQTSGLGTALLTGRKYGSSLTVSVFEGADGQRNLRVTAGQSTEKAALFGAASKSTGKPSAQGIADAKALLSACGQGEIRQQTSSRFFSAVIAATI
jgi:hypothetical protein